jgi:hypothetical protein
MKTMTTQTKTLAGVTVTISETRFGKRSQNLVKSQWVARRADGSILAECCASLIEAEETALVVIGRDDLGMAGSASDILSALRAA